MLRKRILKITQIYRTSIINFLQIRLTVHTSQQIFYKKHKGLHLLSLSLESRLPHLFLVSNRDPLVGKNMLNLKRKQGVAYMRREGCNWKMWQTKLASHLTTETFLKTITSSSRQSQTKISRIRTTGFNTSHQPIHLPKENESFFIV